MRRMLATTTRKYWTSAVLAAAALGLVASAWLLHAGPTAQAEDRSAVASAQRLSDAFSQVAERVSPAVVTLQVETRRKPNAGPGFLWPFGSPERRPGIQRGAGSGIIMRSDGVILTNNHVVAHAHRIDVVLEDGRRFTGKVVGADEATDLAVVKIPANGLPSAKFGDSSGARVGQWVVAIGAPFGLDYTLTAGVLSSVARGGLGKHQFVDFLQTDASINPGNSGGPLVNLEGEVLGINTMIVGRGTGIGFSIASNDATHVAEQLLERGEVKRAWLGVSFQEVTPELASSFGMNKHRGALVGNVFEGSPADEAGLKPGDIVVSVGDDEVVESRDLLRTILRKKVGETVRLGIVRDGERRKLSVKLQERPDAGKGSDPHRRRGRSRGTSSDQLGLTLQPLTPPLARRLDYDGKGKVVVTGVQPGSPAERAGLHRGDVIVVADRRPVTSIRDVQRALRDGSALLRVERGDSGFFTVLKRD